MSACVILVSLTTDLFISGCGTSSIFHSLVTSAVCRNSFLFADNKCGRDPSVVIPLQPGATHFILHARCASCPFSQVSTMSCFPKAEPARARPTPSHPLASHRHSPRAGAAMYYLFHCLLRKTRCPVASKIVFNGV